LIKVGTGTSISRGERLAPLGLHDEQARRLKMFDRQKHFRARVAPLLLGLGVTGLAIGAVQAHSSAEPIRCEIEATSANGTIALQGVVHAEAAVTGSYQFRVVSAGGSGSSNIQQGGNFAAGPNGPAMLGQVRLSSPGAVYDATLEITSNGVTVKCAERVGGAI
jgi:hypothetical protein